MTEAQAKDRLIEVLRELAERDQEIERWIATGVSLTKRISELEAEIERLKERIEFLINLPEAKKMLE